MTLHVMELANLRSKELVAKQVTELTNMRSPEFWGMKREVVFGKIIEELSDFVDEFADCFKSRTNNSKEKAKIYIKGMVIMDSKRNFSNIADKINGPEDDGQSLQYFISESKWETASISSKICLQIAAKPELKGGALILDDSGDEKDGECSAGTGRQYIGWLGKVDNAQVGVFLAYRKDDIWIMTHFDLYILESWFNEDRAEDRKKAGIPDDLKFKTKIEIGLELIRKARKEGLPFSFVSFDSAYGKNASLRKAIHEDGELYMAEVPSNMRILTAKPELGIPENHANKKGPKFSKVQILNKEAEMSVKEFVERNRESFKFYEVRDTERGKLIDEFAFFHVWVPYDENEYREEWLIARIESDGSATYALCNAPFDCSHRILAEWKCCRYFVERSFQEAKSELGWNDFQATKYQSWLHHTALTALATWLIARIKLKWLKKFPRRSKLAKQLEIEVLPLLSVPNVREILKAAFSDDENAKEDALKRLAKCFANRTASTSCRLKQQMKSYQI